MAYYEDVGEERSGLGCSAFIQIAMVVVIIIAMGLVYSMAKSKTVYTSHAKTSHSSEVSSIENCFNGGGIRSVWFIQKNGRYAQYCKDDSGGAYWRIMECEDTAKGRIRKIISQFKQNISGAGRDPQDRIDNYKANNGMVEASPSC